MRDLTDTDIRLEGFRALGGVGAERFVALLMREPFDYTKWQRNLWPEQSVEQSSRAAMESRRSSPGD